MVWLVVLMILPTGEIMYSLGIFGSNMLKAISQGSPAKFEKISSCGGIDYSSYIIWKNSTHTLAKNCTTGNIDYAHENTSATIQWTMDYVSNAGGGLIFVKKDTYYLTPQSDFSWWGRVALVPRSNVYLKLENGTVMNQTHYGDPSPDYENLTSLMIYHNQDDQLKNFVVDGGIWDANHGDKRNTIGVSELGELPPGTYWNLHGFYFAGNSTRPAEDIVVKNLEVRNVASKGICFYHSKRCRAEHVKLDYAGKNSFVIEGSQDYPNWDSEWCTLAFSEIAHSGNAMSAVWKAKRCLFIGNKLHDAEKSDYYLFFADADSEDVNLTGNDFYGTGKVQVSYASTGSIFFQSNSFSCPVWITGGKKNQLANNHFFENVYFYGMSGSPEYTDSVVEGNTFNSCRLEVGTLDKMKTVTVSHNVWEQDSGECVRLQDGAMNVLITENLMQGGFGIKAYGTVAFDNITISYNDVRECSTAISSEVIRGAENSTFVGNDGYNSQGYLSNPWNSTGPYLMDATGASSPHNSTTYTCWQSPKTIYVSGGTMIATTVNGQTVFTTETDFMIYLYSRDTIELQWSSAPTVEVFGE